MSYPQKGEAAVLSFLVPVYPWFPVDRSASLFVGLGVPGILSLGPLLQAGRGTR